MIIYKATNKVNGKVYIGQTTRDLSTRQCQHKWESKNKGGNYFYRAINKYGFDSFEWEIIRICDNMKSLNAYEKYYTSR